MARGMNRVTILGFVERVPEIRHTADGLPVASFVVSTNDNWKASTGVDDNVTEWFSIVAWGDLAEAAEAQLEKDQRLYAEGHLQTRTWDDVEGRRCSRAEVVANKIIPLDTRAAIAARNVESGSDGIPLCVNKITVIGNLGRNPEMRYTPEGHAVTSFSLAATGARTSAPGGRNGATEWFNVVACGNLAEICNQYLAKGRRVYVRGKLRTRGWEQPAGNKRFRAELVADEMIILGPRPRRRSTEQELSEFRSDPHS